MSFYGLNFLFDNQYSENYGLQIKTINSTGVSTVNAGANPSIFGDSIYRKPTRYFYGTSLNEVLTFELEIMSDEPIFSFNRTKIEKWLFGKNNYCRLQIIQQDLQNIYFNCFLLNPKTIYIGNYCYGFSFTVECDAPFAWQFEKTFIYTDNNPVSLEFSIEHYNNSDTNDYTYPYLEIYAGNTGSDVSLINKNDNNRVTKFINCHPNEIITIDNDLHIIQSNQFEYISDRFNKKFFRLTFGLNNISVLGDVAKIVLKYKNVKKVGG